MKYQAGIRRGALQHMQGAGLHAHDRQLRSNDSRIPRSVLSGAGDLNAPRRLVGARFNCEDARIEDAL